MNKDEQLVGAVHKNTVLAKKCTFANPLYHKNLYPNMKKYWRYDKYRGLEESIFSKSHLTNKDKSKIMKFILENFK